MGTIERRTAQGLMLAGAVAVGFALPALAQTKVETEKTAARGEKNGVKGYWVTITDRTYTYEAFVEVVALYRRITERWINNLANNTLESSSGWNESKARSAAANVGWSKLKNYVSSNISKVGGDSNGIVLIDPATNQIIGIVPVSSAGAAHNWLNDRENKVVSASLRGGGSVDIKLTAYTYHGSPILLDLEGLGRPDLLAGPDWKLLPGRKLASNALRAFDLDGTGTASWEWVGPRTGILVWDPGLTGKIKSGKQLFGNYTWGERFDDGYEALAKLDKNGDGTLTGAELESLAIWVDTNSDAVSDPSEVAPVARHGIESISVKAERDAAGHAAARNGFVRRSPDGKKEALATWDWIAMGQARPTEGTYVWVGKSEGKDYGGYLNLRDDRGEIGGLSFPTVGHEQIPGMVVALPVGGRVVEPGKIRWTTPTFGGTVLSEVTWEPGGKHLYGRTKVDTKAKKFEYTWQAELIAGDPIGGGLRASRLERAADR